MSGLSELLPDDGVKAERLLLRELAHRIDGELASAIDLVSRAANRCDATEARMSWLCRAAIRTVRMKQSRGVFER